MVLRDASASKNLAQIGYFGKLNSTLGSVAMFFLRTLHSFSCSWPTTNNGFRSDVLAGYSVKMFWQSIFWPDQNSETCPSLAATRPSRTWLLAGIRGNFLLFAVFEVRWPRPNIELGWPAPCRLGGGHFADLPFHRGELRSRRTENPDSTLRQNPPTLQISHYNFLLVARVRVLNIVSGRGFKFTIDHIF